MFDPLLIYGASGYTGALIVEAALQAGLRPLLAGRNCGRIAALAERNGLDHRIAALDDAPALDAALRDVRAVIHAAGPFAQTARPMVDACLRAGTHYLDISGEVAAIEALARRHREARRRGIMLMPGVGFDVVPSDCLAAHVARRLPNAQRLEIGVRGLAFASRGSLKTIFEQAGAGVTVRRGGELTTVRAAELARTFDYGDGPRQSLAVSWGDVASAHYTTGIPDVTVFFESTPTVRAMLAATRAAGALLRSAPAQAFLQAWTELLPAGPDESARRVQETVVVAEAVDDRGRAVSARLRAPEAYTFTALSAPAIAARVLNGDVVPGFHTPARAYGPDFVLEFPGVCRDELD